MLASTGSTIDATLTLGEVNESLCKTLGMLAPFGLGNPKPIFMFSNVTVVSWKLFGKEKNHLEVIFTDRLGYETTGIAFFCDNTSFSKKVVPDVNVDLVATVEKSYFAGRTTIRLRILDIR